MHFTYSIDNQEHVGNFDSDVNAILTGFKNNPKIDKLYVSKWDKKSSKSYLDDKVINRIMDIIFDAACREFESDADGITDEYIQNLDRDILKTSDISKLLSNYIDKKNINVYQIIETKEYTRKFIEDIIKQSKI